MTSNSEISQQINGVEDEASSVDASSGMNGTGTDAKSGTPLTRSRSGFDLEDTRRQLIALRVKHGANSAIGHRCSNIVELLRAPVIAPPELIARQMRGLQELLAAQ